MTTIMEAVTTLRMMVQKKRQGGQWAKQTEKTCATDSVNLGDSGHQKFRCLHTTVQRSGNMTKLNKPPNV
jgi:hypothetical protein